MLRAPVTGTKGDSDGEGLCPLPFSQHPPLLGPWAEQLPRTATGPPPTDLLLPSTGRTGPPGAAEDCGTSPTLGVSSPSSTLLTRHLGRKAALGELRAGGRGHTCGYGSRSGATAADWHRGDHVLVKGVCRLTLGNC